MIPPEGRGFGRERGNRKLLKSELVVSEDLKALAVLIEQYTERHVSPIFDGDDYQIAEEHEKERRQMHLCIGSNNQATARKTIGAHLSFEPDLLAEIEQLLKKTENERMGIIKAQGITDAIRNTQKLRSQLLTVITIDTAFIDNYYDGLADLLISLSAVRANIKTLEALADGFGRKTPSCVIIFSNMGGGSFTISRQKEIIIFIEKTITCFFEDYMDILFTDIDTGSPRLECSIRVNLEAKMTWDITQLFSDFFKYLFGGNKAESVRTIKRIGAQLNESQKRDTENLKAIKGELSQEEYEARLLAIFDEYSALRRNQIEVAIKNTDITKRLEDRLPLLLEETSSPSVPLPDTP
jgi:hypothetical protein